MTTIELDATPQSDLLWHFEAKDQIIWSFQFGPLKPHTIASAENAVAYFTENIYPDLAENTISARLYSGKPFEELPDYLDRLVALLPEEVPATAIFDLSSIPTRAEAMRLISPEQYPWINVENRPHADGIHGLLFPIEDLCTPENLSELEPHIDSYRIVYEYNFTESWDGLDTIIVFPQMLSPLGKRKLQGFEAAGGKVITKA